MSPDDFDDDQSPADQRLPDKRELSPEDQAAIDQWLTDGGALSPED